MRFSILLLIAFAMTAMAMTMPEARALKIAHRNEARRKGFFNKGRWKRRTKGACTDGHVGEYACNNVNMLDFISHEEMGSITREGNDMWGWTAPDGREIGIIGQTDGTAFVEVVGNGELKYLGRLPFMSDYSIWRDIKVIGHHVYIGTEASGHGLQIFDLNKVTAITDLPHTFHQFDDLTKWYDGFGSSHNLVANEETNMLYIVGTYYIELPGCEGGLYMLNVSDPANPVSYGCVGKDGYVHDAQCVVYHGPDIQYTGHEICFGYNEDTLTIYDVTNKSKPHIISNTTYNGAAYVHQGWLVDNSMRYLLLGDEWDERLSRGPASNNRSTTYIFDVSSLSAPKNTGYYQSPAKTIDHNQYIIDGKSYQANYMSGLRIVNISSVYDDPSGIGFKEVGFFDVHPEDDEGGGGREFLGAWTVWPFFRSGTLLISSIERGVFSVRYIGS